MKQYTPRAIEPKWQQVWQDTKLYETNDTSNQPTSYVLPMFPYPSGDGLHVGHVRNYTITDIIARYKRMTGHHVLHAIGWDAFGLPAENYAIKNGISPQQSIIQNTDNFRAQLQILGLSFDWSKEINTSAPEYYRWTQWIFLELLKRGLAYQKESEQWWCEHDKTVLANEQVEQGRCWRCGNVVTKKLLKQWFFKITDYADRLISDLDGLDWPENIKLAQRNWIGRSEGAEIDFEAGKHKITVYTTRPDTLAGATFLVLAPEHPIVNVITIEEQRQAVSEYQVQAKTQSEIERQSTDRPKTGVFTGAYVQNPLTQDKIPVWIADYVLVNYGTGAIMAVPAHDERDFAFAKAFDLTIKPVIEPVTGTPHGDDHEKEAIVAVVRNPRTNQTLMLDWGPRHSNWGGMLFVGGGVEADEDFVKAAEREIAEETGYTDVKFVKAAEVAVNSYYYSNVKDRHDKARMHGLLFELQSDTQIEPNLDEGEKNKFKLKWVDDNAVFSTVNDDGHGLIYRLLTRDDCFVGDGVLINSGEFDGLSGIKAKHAIVEHLFKQGSGRGATKYKLRDWLISRQRYWGAPIPVIHCPKDGAVPVPANQLPVVLPTVEDYHPTGDGRSPLAKVKDFVQTTCPNCGGPAERETDTMDTFACSSWYFLRYPTPHLDTAAFDAEQVKRWLPVDVYEGGAEHAILHLLYARFWTKALHDAGHLPFVEPFPTLRAHGMILATDGRKMSKSLGNVINPNTVVDSYGADALRLYEMFIGPYTDAAAWSDERLGGVSRFLHRVWTLVGWMTEKRGSLNEAISPGEFELEVDRWTHKTLKKVRDGIEDLRFNTMVSALMEYVNFLAKPEHANRFMNIHHADLVDRTVRHLLLMLAPAVPHMTEELWHELGETGSIHVAAWPAYNPELLREEVVTIAVQVNGKVRGQVSLPADATEAELTAAAQTDAKVAPHLEGKDIHKTIVVPRKIVNFVVK